LNNPEPPKDMTGSTDEEICKQRKAEMTNKLDNATGIL